MKKKKTFLINTVILTVTALILRGIGMFFRVYLSNIIGAEGMGLYQLIISVYMLASTFATSGISTAVTRLCADEMVCGTKKSVFSVLKKSVKLSAILGAVINIVVYSFSSPIADIFIGDYRVAASLKILSFSLVPMGISACFKGYFMARRKTVTPSVASILEQFIRISVILLLLSKYADKGLEKSCFIILLADTIAEIISCIFIFICCVRDKKRGISASGKDGERKGILREIIRISLPITAGKYLTSLLSTVENLIVPKSLGRFSGNRKSGLETFGLIKGMALPIIFFPASFLLSVSTLLIPEISEQALLKDYNSIRKDVSRVLTITILGSILISGCFFLSAEKIGITLYKSKEAGVLISVLSPIIPVMYLESVVVGILKGLDKQNASFIYSLFDSSIRIVLVLCIVPLFGIDGFIFTMYFSNLFTGSLNFIKLLKVTSVRFKTLDWFLKPLISVVFGVIFAKRVCLTITDDIAYIIISSALITLVYTVMLIILKGINFDKAKTINNSIKNSFGK